MEFLVFQLIAPLASWGDTAVGEFRGSREHPGDSALIGLLGTALGIRRDDEAAHASLRDGYHFAVGVVSPGRLLRDYHTAQVPGRAALKGRPHGTRCDELSVPKSELNTILSTREYRQDSACVVAVQASSGAPFTLNELAQRLREPRFVLYLGRKSCPPAEPLAPRLLEAASAHAALTDYLGLHDDASALRSMAWSDGVNAGVQPHLSAPRKDRLIRRRGWQFGDRTEHLALLAKDD